MPPLCLALSLMTTRTSLLTPSLQPQTLVMGTLRVASPRPMRDLITPRPPRAQGVLRADMPSLPLTTRITVDLTMSPLVMPVVLTQPLPTLREEPRHGAAGPVLSADVCCPGSRCLRRGINQLKDVARTLGEKQNFWRGLCEKCANGGMRQMLITIRGDGQGLAVQAHDRSKEKGVLAATKSRPSPGSKKKLGHHMGGQEGACAALLEGRPCMCSSVFQLSHHGC